MVAVANSTVPAHAAREDRASRRVPAGENPEKRAQILKGALNVFQAMGFDAASMNDIARAAGVSKGTLYVYFDNKERLFVDMVAAFRDRTILGLFATLDGETDVVRGLTRYGIEHLRALSSPEAVRAHRIVLGVAERMPDLGAEFYAAGPMRGMDRLAEFLEAHAAACGLDIAVPALAASQFVALLHSAVIRPRLYQYVRDPVTDDEITAAVTAAVEMIRRGYAR